MNGPDGSLMHGEIQIGNSTVMIGEENPQWQTQSAETLGGSPVSMHLYVDDVDSTYQKAVDAGCQSIMPVTDMFWGDRYCKVIDPFGIQWGIATHVEDIDEAELAKRSEAWAASMANSEGCN